MVLGWSSLDTTSCSRSERTTPDHTHDTPKVLDDLLDVEIKEPEFSDSFGFYINTGGDSNLFPNATDGWGRYSVDVANRTIEFNRYDLDGKDLWETGGLFDFTKG